MKANFKREVKRNKNKHMIRRETRENEPLLSRVVDPPGTKGGSRAGNFPGPPKNTFCPGWIHDPGQKGLLSRVVASPGIKDVFGQAGKIPSPWPTFIPGWIYHPGQKGPVFPHSRQTVAFQQKVDSITILTFKKWILHKIK